MSPLLIATTIALTASGSPRLSPDLGLQEPPSAAEPDSCQVFIARLEDAAAARGYEVRPTKSGAQGNLASAQFEAHCDAGHVALELFEYRGATIQIELSGDPVAGFALTLDADFPGVGQVSQFTMIDDFGTEPWSGVINFAASTGTAEAFVEFDLENATWREGGAVEPVNNKFTPALRISRLWKDAHVLSFALAGIWGSMDEDAVDALLPLAVPSPGIRGVDQDLIHQKSTCKVAGYVCTVAAVFHKLIPGCVVAYPGCLQAASCVSEDCSGDGGTTTG